MSTSPERCLGGLMKDIDKEIPLEEKESNGKEEKHNNINDNNINMIESKDSFYQISLDIDKKLSLKSINSINSLSTTIPSLSSTDSTNNNIISNLNNLSNLYNSSSYQSSLSINKYILLNAFNSQHDTIYLQKMLKGASKQILYQIINELKGTFSLIIKNKNGNYFCSDLFKACDHDLRIIILKELSLTLDEDSLNEYGTHSIQTLIEKSTTQEEFNLILKPFNECNKILKAATNSNGFYVIQKIINHIPENNRMEFNFLFLKLFYNLSIDIYGISSVKSFIIFTKNEQILNQIWVLTQNNFILIAKNKYGNYLIQCMLEHWSDTNYGIKLKKLIINYFPEMMENHYSKFICDLFINRSNIEEKKIVLATLLKSKNNLNLFNNINKKNNNYNLNNKKNNFCINNNINNNIIQNNNNNKIYVPLPNNAKPFIPNKKNNNNNNNIKK